MGKRKESENKQLILSLFDQIQRQTKYHIIDVDFSNSYFAFDGDEDSICEFHIKEIPGFIFGIWSIKRYDTLQYELEHNIPLWVDSLNINSKSELIFFTQYERDVDKFKPSRSGFVTGLFRESWEEENDKGEIVKLTEWYINELENILDYMHKHKVRAAIYAQRQTRFIWDDDSSSLKLFHEYIHDWIYYIRTTKKEARLFKRDVAYLKRQLPKLKMFNYILCDDGENCYPRLQLNCRHKEIIDICQYDKDCMLLDKIEDKCHHNLNVQYMQYFDSEDIDNAEYLEKDKDIRARFFWICDKWLNDFHKDTILCHNVEAVSDLEALKQYVESEFKQHKKK